MNLKFSFKHMKHSPEFDRHIKDKSEKFEKYFQGHLNIQWHFWVHEDEHWAECKIHGPKFDFFAKACGDNMYKSLDLAFEKMEKQIEKQKELKRDRLHHDWSDSPKHREMKRQISDEEYYIYSDPEEWSA
jgi:putative sigma-54 modulation protein